MTLVRSTGREQLIDLREVSRFLSLDTCRREDASPGFLRYRKIEIFVENERQSLLWHVISAFAVC